MKQRTNAVLGILNKISEGFLAGMMISLGGAVYLACTAAGTPVYGKYVGALLFSMALLCICMRGYALYTGKIGLVIDNHKKEDISLLLLCLLGNLLGTVAFGYLIGWVFPSLKETALALCGENGKLGQGYGFGLLRAVLCGILVYLAIDLYRNNKTPLGILMCIPAFILSGYEHSIADMFYFACSGIVSGEAFLYLMMIVLGNSLGALIIPALRLIHPRKSETAEQPPETAAPAAENATETTATAKVKPAAKTKPEVTEGNKPAENSVSEKSE